MRIAGLVGVVSGLMLAISPARADQIDAVAECEPAGEVLEYRCLYRLTSGGAPLEGAIFTIKPDMPSMPMAHNIPPVSTEPTHEPGVYEATFRLDMHGRWSMRLEFSAPQRDIVVLHADFEPAEGTAEQGHDHGGRRHDHGGGDQNRRHDHGSGDHNRHQGDARRSAGGG